MTVRYILSDDLDHDCRGVGMDLGIAAFGKHGEHATTSESRRAPNNQRSARLFRAITSHFLANSTTSQGEPSLGSKMLLLTLMTPASLAKSSCVRDVFARAEKNAPRPCCCEIWGTRSLASRPKPDIAIWLLFLPNFGCFRISAPLPAGIDVSVVSVVAEVRDLHAQYFNLLHPS